MKYVTLQNRQSGMTSAIVFDDALVHAEVARAARRTHVVLGAGFCRFDRSSCEWLVGPGGSDSLRISPHPDDRAVLNRSLVHGMTELDQANYATLAALRLAAGGKP